MKIRATVDYEQLRQIGVGQGLNSTVYLAKDPQLAGELAVKEVPLSSFPNTAGYFTEAQAMFAADHPNVAPVLWAGTTASHICMAMPFFRNGSLADKAGAGPLRLSDVIRYGQDVVAGLGSIHRAGYIHFDVKPSNVLISDTDSGLVADFGQSRAFGPGGVVSIPQMYRYCVPPEWFSGAAMTTLADVYQVGLLLYRIANGEDHWKKQIPLPTALAAKVTAGRFPDRSLFLPHVPDPLRRVIRKALHPDPVRRYQSASELGAALGRVPVRLNWRCSPGPAGEITWEADRDGQPSLLIELAPGSGGGWDVKMFTKGSTLRRQGASTYWRTNIKRTEAERHLSAHF